MLRMAARRTSRGWGTRFGRWVDRQTVPGLVSRLSLAGLPVTRQAVYRWVAGLSAPSPARMEVMRRLSGGRLGLADFMGPSRACRETVVLSTIISRPLGPGDVS